MCDYSLTHYKSRPARVGEKLVTHRFLSGSGGFASSDDYDTPVCLLPGTELAFEDEVKLLYAPGRVEERTARFRQIDTDTRSTHHDALEFSSGELVKLTYLAAGNIAVVLQLPAAPKTAEEAKAQQRVEAVG